MCLYFNHDYLNILVEKKVGPGGIEKERERERERGNELRAQVEPVFMGKVVWMCVLEMGGRDGLDGADRYMVEWMGQ